MPQRDDHQGVDGVWRETEHAEAADVGDDVDVAQSAIIHPPMPRGPAMLK